MRIAIITLFPDMFEGPFGESIIKRAQDEGQVEMQIHNLRDWAIDERGTVDDRPYGGGTGMLLRPEPIFDSVEEIRNSKFEIRNKTRNTNPKSQNNNGTIEQWNNEKVILLDAGGKLYTQQTAQRFSKLASLILICGHYEGVDYRVHEYLADEVISIGDYILTGGEIPAMVIIDSVTRLLPGVLEPEATRHESFSMRGQRSKVKGQLLEYPQYTRPEEYRGHTVPDILLSGHHAEVEKWRKEQALERTKQNRSDLLK